MNIRDWMGVVAATLAITGSVSAGGVWVADQRYITQEDMLVREIRQLDREVTFLQIKIANGEASQSEKIYIESLKQQLRDLKQQVK